MKIKGISKFMTTHASKVGWHILTETRSIGYVEWSAQNIITLMSENGYTLIGWTGNGLIFQKG